MFRFPFSVSRVALAGTLAVSLAIALAPQAQALSAAQALKTMDATLATGYFDLEVRLYGPPDKNGKPSSEAIYPAQLLFARPDRFRLVLRPGAKDEYRIVAQAGVVQWLDLSTGLSGKDAVEKQVDPLALALLGAAGELTRHADLKDRPSSKQDTFFSADLRSRTWGSAMQTGRVWYDGAGRPVTFEFLPDDGSRMRLVVTRYVANPKTSSKDFQL